MCVNYTIWWPVFRDFSRFRWWRLQNSGIVNGEFGIKNWQVFQGLLIIEVSRSHSGTLHLVWIHRTSDRPDAETSTGQLTALRKDNHALAWFESKIPASERPQTFALYLAATGFGTSAHSLDIPLKRKSRQFYLHFSQFIFLFYNIWTCACLRLWKMEEQRARIVLRYTQSQSSE